MAKIQPDRYSAIHTAEGLGQLVRAARLEMGLSQEAGALLAGVGARFLSELERGKGTVQLAKVIQVTRAFGIRLGGARVR